MKITLIGPVYPYRGGIALFTSSLARELEGQGHQVQLLSYNRQYPSWLYPGKSDKDPVQKNVDPRVQFLFSPLNPIDWLKTLRAIKKNNPDLIVVQWWTLFWTPAYHWLFKRLRKQNQRLVVIVHNTVPHEKKAFDEFFARAVLQQANEFICMNPNDAKKLQQLIKCEASQIKIVPHPVYQPFEPTGMTKEELRALLGLPYECKVILFFGFVRAYKGLSYLLEAMPILMGEGVPIRLVIAGEFWEKEDIYIQQLAKLGIEDMVSMYPEYIPDDQAAKFFEVADVFVAPYTGGTQSGSVKLALGYGLPIVVTEVVADELVRQSPGKMEVVEAGNAVDLATGIKTILQQPSGLNDTREFLNQSSWNTLIQALEFGKDDKQNYGRS